MAPHDHDHGHGMGDHLHIHRHTVVHDLPAQTKLVALLAFVIVVVATPAASWWAFVAYAGLIIGVMLYAQLPLKTMAKRMVVETPFIVFAVLMPFVGTGPRTEFLGLEVSELGLITGATLIAKSTLGVMASLCLSATTPAREILRGLEALKVPALLIHIATFMLRYSAVVLDELRRMKVARESRGFSAKGPGEWRIIAQTAGALFIRSYERGERVHLAMLSRGFAGEMPQLHRHTVTARAWATSQILPLAALVVLIIRSLT